MNLVDRLSLALLGTFFKEIISTFLSCKDIISLYY